MPSNDNLGDIVNAVRSELGYGIFRDNNNDLDWSSIRRGIYWLFRNIAKPVVPAFDEMYIIVFAAVRTNTDDNLDFELLRQNDYDLIQLLPRAVESFPKVFRAGMQGYLEQRQYVTKPQQAVDYATKQMIKSLSPSQNSD